MGIVIWPQHPKSLHWLLFGGLLLLELGMPAAFEAIFWEDPRADTFLDRRDGVLIASGVLVYQVSCIIWSWRIRFPD